MSSSRLYNVIQFMVELYVKRKICDCLLVMNLKLLYDCCKTYSVQQHFHSTWHSCTNCKVTIAFIKVNT